jgi:hypothetical protein
MPNNLQETHNEFINDPNWLTLVSELAVLRTLMAKHTKDLDGVAVLELWKRADILWSEARDANADGNQALLTRKFNELGEVLSQGISETKHHDKTLSLIYKDADSIRRMVEAEKSLAITKNEMIPIMIVFGIADLFLRSLRDEVVPLDGGTEATKVIGKTIYDYMARYLGSDYTRDNRPGENLIEVRSSD